MAKKKKPRLPTTKGEWQSAVDLAGFFVLLDAARAYGLVTGGPDVNVDRCQEIIEAGKKKGMTPRVDAVQPFVDQTMPLSTILGRRGSREARGSRDYSDRTST
jgi:hypothetical protein